METETQTPKVAPKMTAPPNSTDAPKRRGRPPGSTNKTKETLAETPITGSAPKRGRPRKVQSVELDVGSVAKQLKGAHFLIGSMTGIPELFVSDQEAGELAVAMCDFAREYDVTLNPKVMAGIQLLAVCGMIYVPRGFAVVARVRKVKASRSETRDDASGVAENVNSDHVTAVN